MNNKIVSIFGLKKYCIQEDQIKVKSGPLKIISDVLLEKDKGYHLKLNEIDNVILFGDIDHINKNDSHLINNILTALSDFFSIECDDISYSLSEKIINNELSYHWGFSGYNTNIKNLKTQMKLFISSYPQFKVYLDTSIYKKGWFRLPNQTNKDKIYKHEIIKGKISNFIVNYIPTKSEELPIKTPLKEKIETCKKINENIKTHKEESNEQTEKIKKLLSCLNSSRFNYEYWLNIGFIIYNETNNINIWKNWSKNYKKYDEDEVNNKWLSMKDNTNNKLGIGTLKMYAKEDNEILYNELFKSKNKFKLFDEILTTRAIGNHFKSLYGDKFVYQNGKLYYYNNVYWSVEDIKEKLININNFIADVYFKDVNELYREYETDKLKRKGATEDTINILKQIKGYLLNLLNHDKRQKLINELICMLANDQIKFDNNPYLFAFNNKIYDLTKGDFIEPKPEQYISITTGYNFTKQDETKNIKFVNELINTIFPQPELKKLYLTILSTGLDAVPLEKFILSNGGGGNGKGVLNEFVQYMLGNFAYVLPVNILLGPLKTGSNPELANMNHKRLIIAREPDKNLLCNY